MRLKLALTLLALPAKAAGPLVKFLEEQPSCQSVDDR
jgi:hypothetical protein